MGRDNIKVMAVVLLAVLATAALFMLVPGPQRMDLTAYTPARDLAAAKRVAEDIRTQNFAVFSKAMAPEYGTPHPDTFALMGSFVPNRTVESETVALWQIVSVGGHRSTRIDLYYDYGAAGVSEIQTLLSDAGPEPRLMGVHVNLYPAQVAHANDFRWPSRWNDPRWAMLAVAAAFDLAAFITFGLCAINRDIRWRWRWVWMLFVLTAVGRLNINWVTLQMNWMLVNAMVPPAGFYKFAAYGPWVMSLGLPVAVAVYWVRVRTWARERVEHPLGAF